jgi:hypothetical protein
VPTDNEPNSGVHACNPSWAEFPTYNIATHLYSNFQIFQIMNMPATTNGEYNASFSTTSPRGDKQTAAAAQRSPPNDLLGTVDPDDASADLAVALSLDLDQQQDQLWEVQDPASYYWDASTMAPLNAVSAVSTLYRSFIS